MTVDKCNNKCGREVFDMEAVEVLPHLDGTTTIIKHAAAEYCSQECADEDGVRKMRRAGLI